MKTELIKKTKAQSELEEKKKRKRILILIFSAFIILFLLLLIANNFDFSKSSTAPAATPSYMTGDGNALEGAAASKSREDILEELKKQQLVVTDKLSSNITFPSGKAGAIGEWIVENPSANNIIQQAEVYYKDQFVAKSSPIYPNQHIEAITLKQDIQSGEYDVTAYINYYNMDTKEFISKAGYKIHLTIR